VNGEKTSRQFSVLGSQFTPLRESEAACILRAAFSVGKGMLGK
jgi:hypothetical protein